MKTVEQMSVGWREKSMFQFYIVARNTPILKHYGRVFANMLIPWTDSFLPKYTLPGLNLVWTHLGLAGFDRPNFLYFLWWQKELKNWLRSTYQSLDEYGIFTPRSIMFLLKPNTLPDHSFERAASVLGMTEIWYRQFVEGRYLQF